MNRDAIVAAVRANPLKTREVFVTEWNDSVTIRELSAAQARVAFAKLDQLNTFLLIASVINEDGTLAFKDSPDDIKFVESMPHSVVRLITDEVTVLNNFDKKIEELQKNSLASQS